MKDEIMIVIDGMPWLRNDWPVPNIDGHFGFVVKS
jgi:hypothetical protein